MITISKQYNFKANDFFDYLDRQLIESINLDEISPKEAYMLLVKLKELIGE